MGPSRDGRGDDRHPGFRLATHSEPTFMMAEDRDVQIAEASCTYRQPRTDVGASRVARVAPSRQQLVRPDVTGSAPSFVDSGG